MPTVDDIGWICAVVTQPLRDPSDLQQRRLAWRVLAPASALVALGVALALGTSLTVPFDSAWGALARQCTAAGLAVGGMLLAYRRMRATLVLPALRAIEQHAHDLGVFEASRDGIVVVDGDSIICSFSPSAETMFGRMAADAIGQPLDILFPDVHAPRPDPALRRRDLQLHQGAQRELLGRRADGSTFPVSRYRKRIARPGAEPLICHVFRDLTEQSHEEYRAQLHALEIERTNVQLDQAKREAEAARTQAEAASRSKSEFLANMSHEIRTPMTAILGFAENLLDETLGTKERRDAIETILRNGDHLMTVIDDILDLSKIEAGRMTIERMPISPRDLLTDVANLMRVRADAKRLQLRVRSDGQLPATIATDPTRLRQVLINLCGNAIKFTESGTVTLTCRLLDDQRGGHLLQFEVRDTGIGMTNEQLAYLFQPFSQADNSTTRRFGGTGLGLSISKRLVEMLGGSIDVVSEPGLGSSFTFTIDPGNLAGVPMVEPLFESSPARAVASGASATAQNGALPSHLRGRILVAEDGPDNQRLITHLLHKFGAEVTVVADGRSAVSVALAAESTQAPFDLVLMDMQMPVMDGYQAAGELRRIGYQKPIVALTANAMSGDRERCIAAGCTDFTPKPVERKALLGVLQRLLQHPQAEA
jgi:PAS domain S-box-containing protein